MGKYVCVANTLDLSFDGMNGVQEKVHEAPILGMSLHNSIMAASLIVRV